MVYQQSSYIFSGSNRVGGVLQFHRNLPTRYRCFDTFTGFGNQNDLRSVSKCGRSPFLSALNRKLQVHILQCGDRDFLYGRYLSLERIQLCSICRPQICMISAYADLRRFLRNIFQSATRRIHKRPVTVTNDETNVRFRIRITKYRIAKLHPGFVQLGVQINHRIRTNHPERQSLSVERRSHRFIVLVIFIAPSGKYIVRILSV